MTIEIIHNSGDPIKQNMDEDFVMHDNLSKASIGAY